MIGNREKTAERAARWFAWEWAAVFIQALARQKSVKSRVEWAAVGPEEQASMVWWRQPYVLEQSVSVWAGMAEDFECPELLAESFSDMAWILNSRGRIEARCEVGQRSEAPPEGFLRVALEVKRQSGPAWLIVLAFEPEFLDAFGEAAEPDARASSSERLDLMLDLELPVSISFGSTQMPFEEVARLTSGAIVEFNRMIDEPVQILVNERVVASGEVVVVNGHYGVRITRVAAQKGSACIN